MMGRILSLVVAACLIWIVPPGAARAADNTGAGGAFFYRGLPYGSDAAFHPASELVNGAFGILQISSNWVTLDRIDFRQGLDITWRSITQPGRTVDAYGRSAFVTDQLVPATFRWNNLQYVPNYTLHLVGGGARHRAFTEWYRAHGFAAPVAWAWGTTILHAFAVESVEHYAENQPTVDPVADMLLFDPLGALLFSSDRVAGFFANTLNMGIWSGQPAYNPVENTIENAGENYGLHLFFGDTHRVGLFAYLGMSDLFGVTVRRGALFDWSVGLGGAVAELNARDRGNGTTSLFARIQPSAGFFLHRNRSLLASVQVSQAWTQLLRVQIYPGVFDVHGFSTGFYTGIRDNDVIVGVSFSRFPIGLAVSR